MNSQMAKKVVNSFVVLDSGIGKDGHFDGKVKGRLILVKKAIPNLDNNIRGKNICMTKIF